MHVYDIPPVGIQILALCLGLVWGSFLNVVIVRLPKNESVAFPGSHCACGTPIAAYDNIPVISWLILRGRARCCKAPISYRYPTVEAFGGLLLLIIANVDMLSTPDAPLWRASLVALSDSGLALGILAATFIDIEHMYLPDPITIGGTVVALATSFLRSPGPVVSFAAALTGFLVVYLLFIVGYRLLRGHAGMGLGDAKLLALIGAWQGFSGLLFAVFAGSLQALIVAAAVFVVRGEIREPESVIKEREAIEAAGESLDPAIDPLAAPPKPGFSGARMAFGPFLGLAALEFMVFGPFIAGWVANLLTGPN